MIEVKDLYKSFGKNHVLNNINISIDESKITVIAGPNSSGKTTLIKSILGLVSIDKGDIFVNDENISNSTMYREKIGYMPQIGRYPDNQSIRDVLDMIKDLRGKKQIIKEDQLISIFGLEEHLTKKMSTLSGGTRQKVSAVLAFMFEPDILILDEPTTGLDPVSASKIKEMIIEEKNKGKTVIIISHIMSEVEELADKVIFILDGEIKFQNTVNSILEQTNEKSLEKAIAKIISLN